MLKERFKKPDLHQIFYKSSYHHIHAKKLSSMIFWGSWIFCRPNLPRFFFLGLKKNTTTERSPFRAANKRGRWQPNRPPFALKPSFGIRWIGRLKPPKGAGWNGAGWRLPPFLGNGYLTISHPKREKFGKIIDSKCIFFWGGCVNSLEGNINPLKFGIKKHRTIAFG